MSPTGASARRPPPWLAPVEDASPEPVADAAGERGRWGQVGRAVGDLRGDLVSPAVALLVAWSGLFVLLWAAAVGAVAGVLVATGLVGASPTPGPLQVTGAPGLRPWHVAGGLLSGAGGSVVAVAGDAFGSPLAVGAWLAAGFLLAVVALAGCRRFEAGLLRLRGYRRPSAAELRRIAGAAQRAGAPVTGPRTGRLLVVDAEAPHVRAFVEHVALSTGFLDRYADEELAALLCRVFWQQAHGVGLRRAFVACCGWPVLLLDAVGLRLQQPPVPGGVRAAAWLALWPARLLGACLGAVERPRTALDTYDADAAAGRTGLGPALVAALERAGGAGARAVSGLGPRPAVPATALRIERLEPRRPLDAFFAPPDPAPITRATPRSGVVLGTAAAVVLVAVGVWMSAGTAPGPNEGALASAASYTVSFLDASFDRAQYHRVIEAAVAPALVPAVERQADASSWGVTAALARAAPSTSRAAAVACRALPAGVHGGTRGRVVVRVRWAYSVAGNARQVVVTDLVPLGFAAGRWRPTAAPSPEPAGGVVARSPGFGPCHG